MSDRPTVPDSPAAPSPADLARRVLDLWQDYLSHLAEDPQWLESWRRLLPQLGALPTLDPKLLDPKSLDPAALAQAVSGALAPWGAMMAGLFAGLGAQAAAQMQHAAGAPAQRHLGLQPRQVEETEAPGQRRALGRAGLAVVPSLQQRLVARDGGRTGGHRPPPSARAFSARRPRARRLVTVPIGRSSTAAVSW